MSLILYILIVFEIDHWFLSSRREIEYNKLRASDVIQCIKLLIFPFDVVLIHANGLPLTNNNPNVTRIHSVPFLVSFIVFGLTHTTAL